MGRGDALAFELDLFSYQDTASTFAHQLALMRRPPSPRPTSSETNSTGIQLQRAAETPSAHRFMTTLTACRNIGQRGEGKRLRSLFPTAVRLLFLCCQLSPFPTDHHHCTNIERGGGGQADRGDATSQGELTVPKIDVLSSPPRLPEPTRNNRGPLGPYRAQIPYLCF
jgi:hypothetical protein